MDGWVPWQPIRMAQGRRIPLPFPASPIPPEVQLACQPNADLLSSLWCHPLQDAPFPTSTCCATDSEAPIAKPRRYYWINIIRSVALRLCPSISFLQQPTFRRPVFSCFAAADALNHQGLPSVNTIQAASLRPLSQLVASSWTRTRADLSSSSPFICRAARLFVSFALPSARPTCASLFQPSIGVKNSSDYSGKKSKKLARSRMSFSEHSHRPQPPLLLPLSPSMVATTSLHLARRSKVMSASGTVPCPAPPIPSPGWGRKSPNSR